MAQDPPYIPEKAKAALSGLTEDQTPKEQAEVLVGLDTEDFRQVLIGMLVGDI